MASTAPEAVAPTPTSTVEHTFKQDLLTFLELQRDRSSSKKDKYQALINEINGVAAPAGTGAGTAAAESLRVPIALVEPAAPTATSTGATAAESSTATGTGVAETVATVDTGTGSVAAVTTAQAGGTSTTPTVRGSVQEFTQLADDATECSQDLARRILATVNEHLKAGAFFGAMLGKTDSHKALEKVNGGNLLEALTQCANGFPGASPYRASEASAASGVAARAPDDAGARAP